MVLAPAGAGAGRGGKAGGRVCLEVWEWVRGMLVLRIQEGGLACEFESGSGFFIGLGGQCGLCRDVDRKAWNHDESGMAGARDWMFPIMLLGGRI